MYTHIHTYRNRVSLSYNKSQFHFITKKITIAAKETKTINRSKGINLLKREKRYNPPINYFYGLFGTKS